MNVCNYVTKAAIVAGVAVCGVGFWGTASGADTVQVDIKSLLNARSVSTFSNGKVYTWIKGIDGGGTGDGYVTRSVAVFLNHADIVTLPDSARFPANANHPTMMLNYSNSDSIDFQTHYLAGSDSVTFSVPQGNYSALYLALMSAEGSTAIKVVLNYSDGPVTSAFTLPDYDQGFTNASPGNFYVDSGMEKWTNQNVPVDNPYHNLNGFCVATNSAKTLTGVKLVKTTTGSYLLLWGVTGVGGNITTSMSRQTAKASSGAVRILNCRDGRIQFLNVKAGTELSVFSLSGERVARIASDRQGTLTLGSRDADAVVCPGVYICELRQGLEIQLVQAMVAR